MALVKTDKHENVSIYPFSGEEIDSLMTHATEAVLMWTTKDGWPVGVTHAFVWHDGKIWLTFTAQRHRMAAIKRDNRVSVNVSSASYGVDAEGLPTGAITFKGRAEIFEDENTRSWFYNALAKKWMPDSPDVVLRLLESPIRIVLGVEPEKKIMYNSRIAEAHLMGTLDESKLGKPLESDSKRFQSELQSRGILS